VTGQNGKGRKEDVQKNLLKSDGISDTQHTNFILLVLSGLSVPEIKQKLVLYVKMQKYSIV
jgi:hypothetical protein